VTALSRRAFVGGLAGLGGSAAGLALMSSACELLPSGLHKLPRIGVLASGTRESLNQQRLDASLEGLRDLGCIEGQTVAIEWRFTQQGRDAQFAELAAELARMPVDLIIAWGSTPAVLAARQTTRAIPIFALSVAYPVQTGLVLSLARPAGNLTASTSTAPGLAGKQLELLREVVPGVARVAVFVDATNPAYDIVGWEELQAANDEAGVDLERIGLRSADDLDAAIGAAVSSRAGAVFDRQNPLWQPVRARYARLALQHGLPWMSGQREYVEVGHFMAYGANYPDLFRKSAVYVDTILKGTKPEDLPVQQPTLYDLKVNTTTMQALGLSIPPDVAAQVTEWVE
jgi:putative ABC transport system substrate-binding protein